MAVFDIPTTVEESNYTEEVELEGRTYTLRYYFNGRDNYWYLDVADFATQRAIVSGQRLTLETGFFTRHQDLDKPAGELFLLDTENSDVECGRQDLGNRVKHIYMEESDVLTL